MSRQKTKQGRSMTNDPRIYDGVASRLEGVLAEVPVSNRHNAVYGTGDLNGVLLRGTVRDASGGGCANAAHGMPSDRWVASMLGSLAPDTAQRMFEGQVRQQVDMMSKLGKIPKGGITVAIDCHLVCRYDRKPGEELTRSRYKNGTKYFERYITVQCVDRRMRLDLGAPYLKMGDSVPKHTGRLVDCMGNLGLDVKMVLLDREFFSVDAIAELARRDVGFLMPCRNTGSVVAALREFADGRRGRASDQILENTSGSAPYTMLIERRKKSKMTGAAEDRYIGFATNRPESQIRSYAARWGIESGYGVLEAARVKTRIRSRGARMMCFYYSLLAFNEWIILRIILSSPADHQNPMTMLVFKEMAESMIRQPKPPPDK